MAFRRSGVALAEPEVLEGAADLRLVGLLLASAMIPFSVLDLVPIIASAATSLVIVHLAGGTSTIRVGSGGIMLPNHAPLAIVEQLGTLESLFPRRIDLGMECAPGGSGGSFPQDVMELQGHFCPVLKDQLVQAVPSGGLEVPLYRLGSSDFERRLAAEMGLPFAFASHFAPDYLETALAQNCSI